MNLNEWQTPFFSMLLEQCFGLLAFGTLEIGGILSFTLFVQNFSGFFGLLASIKFSVAKGARSD